MTRLMRVVAFLTGLVPVSCHYAITAPRLWAHNSSAAFDLWMGLWIFGIVFLAMCWYSAYEGKEP